MWPVYLHVARLECYFTVSYIIMRLFGSRGTRGKAVQIGISAERCLLFWTGLKRTYEGRGLEYVNALILLNRARSKTYRCSIAI